MGAMILFLPLQLGFAVSSDARETSSGPRGGALDHQRLETRRAPRAAASPRPLYAFRGHHGHRARLRSHDGLPRSARGLAESKRIRGSPGGRPAGVSSDGTAFTCTLRCRSVRGGAPGSHRAS